MPLQVNAAVQLLWGAAPAPLPEGRDRPSALSQFAAPRRELASVSAQAACAETLPEGSGECLARPGGVAGAAPQVLSAPGPIALPVVVPEDYAGIPTKFRTLAQERAEYIRLVVDAAARMSTTEQAASWLVAQRDRAAVPLLAASGKLATASRCYNNFRRWKTLLGRTRTGDVDVANWRALVDAYQIGSRGRPGPGAWWDLFTALYRLQAEPSAEQSWRDACNTWRRGGQAGEPPTIGQVRHWLRYHDDKLARLQVRKGDVWFRNHVIGYIAREYDSIRVGEVWIGDHRKSDCFAKCPAQDSDGWVPRRLWITAWRDAKSGHFTGWTLYPGDEAPDSHEILRCLVLAIIDAGGVPPPALYVDNGKDFQAAGFLTPVLCSGQETSIARALGIEVITAIAFNPKAKPIENSFKTLIPYYDQRMPGYCGSDRGPKFDVAWRWAKEHTAELPSLQQARELFAWALQEHEERTTASVAQAGVRTAELWAARTAIRPALTPEDLHLRTLLPLGDRETRQIDRGPAGPSVRFDCAYYSGSELREYARRHWGENVLLLRDVFAPPAVRAGRCVPAYLYAAQPDGRLIGRCTVHDTSPFWARTDEEREALGEAMSRVRRLESETRSRGRAERAGIRGNSPLAVMSSWLNDRLALPPPQRPDQALLGSDSLIHSVPPADSAAYPTGNPRVLTTPPKPTAAESASSAVPPTAAIEEFRASLLRRAAQTRDQDDDPAAGQFRPPLTPRRIDDD